MKRLIALLLAVAMVLGLSTALADEDTWDCPNCGKQGNKGLFCPECGGKKPEEPVVTEAPAGTDIKPGDYVYLGQYEQDNNTNSTEKIEWLVIDVKDGKLFLLSKLGIARHRFNNKSDGKCWGDCELRGWLNSDFYNAAFSSAEKDAIQTTQVDDGPDQTNPAWDKAGRYSKTEDKIFLLSYQEMNTLVSSSDRMCEPSYYVTALGVYTEKHNGHMCCWYWLRTSAFKNNAGVVDANGEYSTCYIHHDYGVVRPACWVDASAVTK